MVSVEASFLGIQLDEHHDPETNGRMSVCRRCGSLTDGPTGLHHTPTDGQLSRSTDWLSAQARMKLIERRRSLARSDRA
jgi:hypothetical protein